MLNVLVKSLGEDIARYADEAQRNAEKLTEARKIVESAVNDIDDQYLLEDELLEKLQATIRALKEKLS